MTTLEWYRNKFKDKNFNIEELLVNENYEFESAKIKLEKENNYVA